MYGTFGRFARKCLQKKWRPLKHVGAKANWNAYVYRYVLNTYTMKPGTRTRYLVIANNCYVTYAYGTAYFKPFGIAIGTGTVCTIHHEDVYRVFHFNSVHKMVGNVIFSSRVM
jgi:hypothetical protein